MKDQIQTKKKIQVVLWSSLQVKELSFYNYFVS